MKSHRVIVGASMLALLIAAVGCGGVTQFQGAQSIAVVGQAPPPPPPPPPEPPKPPPRVELKDNKIDFKEKIQFEVNKATIKEESSSLLHDIAEVILKNPQVKKISIEGHASKEGDAKANKKLSDDRAKAVMKWLVDKEKVPAASLTAKGWGSEKPLDGVDQSTEEGREKNRRVEFLVTEQDVTQKKVEIDPTTGKEKVLETKKETIKTGEPEPPKGPDGKPAPPPGGKPPPPPPGGKPAPPPTGGTAKPTTTPAPKPAEKK